MSTCGHCCWPRCLNLAMIWLNVYPQYSICHAKNIFPTFCANSCVLPLSPPMPELFLSIWPYSRYMYESSAQQPGFVSTVGSTAGTFLIHRLESQDFSNFSTQQPLFVSMVGSTAGVCLRCELDGRILSHLSSQQPKFVSSSALSVRVCLIAGSKCRVLFIGTLHQCSSTFWFL